jgi:anti-sigma-K factor RskA
MGWLAKEDQATITYSHLNSANSEEPTFTPQAQSWRRKHFSGWRFGVIACAIAAVLVFLVNLIILLWAESMNGFALLADDGKHTLYDGSCDKTKNLNIGVHLMINTLSTVLLSASNYW